VPCLAQHEYAILIEIVGIHKNCDGFFYQSVSVTCTPGKNGGLIEVKFVSEFCAVLCDSILQFLYLQIL
jgi:hypothetical protein